MVDGTRHLVLTPWSDPVIDRVGHDPRSPYVERFWLSVLGPSATWLLRRFARELDDRPDGTEVDLALIARSLGLGLKGGRHSTFLRSIDRSCEFGLARYLDPHTLAVRRRLPPLTRIQVARLPESLRSQHEAWVSTTPHSPEPAEMQRRARRLALSLLEMGEDQEACERQLHRWRFHPAIAHDAVRWALEALARPRPPAA